MDSASPTEVSIAGNQSDVSGGFTTVFGFFSKLLAGKSVLGSQPRARRDRRSQRHHPRGHGHPL
ncbi:MAG: hypothetical protein ACOCPT_05900 [Halanaeroarchaeum sp.]